MSVKSERKFADGTRKHFDEHASPPSSKKLIPRVKIRDNLETDLSSAK